MAPIARDCNPSGVLGTGSLDTAHARVLAVRDVGPHEHRVS